LALILLIIFGIPHSSQKKKDNNDNEDEELKKDRYSIDKLKGKINIDGKEYSLKNGKIINKNNEQVGTYEAGTIFKAEKVKLKKK